VRLVQSRQVLPIQLSILRRDPPPKHHPTRTRHREQVAIPRGLRGVCGEGAVGVVIADKVFKFCEQEQIAWMAHISTWSR